MSRIVDRKVLADGEMENVLAQAEARVFVGLQLTGLSAGQARNVMNLISGNGHFRAELQTVCDLSPSEKVTFKHKRKDQS